MATELRKTGISVVGDLPWGAHFCYFYETKQDLLDILIPYFKTGLENKEFCLWVISNSELLTVEEATSALQNVLPDLDRYLAEGSIEVVGHDDWFLSGDIFDPHTVADRFRKKLNEALARGYAGMRVNGSPAWLRDAGQKELRKFEAELDKLFPNERTIASCTYPLASIGGEEIFDVVRTHQFAIARRQGEWEIVETPELIQAKAEIRRLNEELEQRVAERTNELRVANEELRKEIAERKHAEALLHAKEKEFRAIVENAPDQIIRYDREFRRTYVNPAVAQFYGLPAETLMGKPLGSDVPQAGLEVKEEELAQVRQRIASVFNTGKTCDYELTWTMPAGRTYFSIRLFPELDLNGSIVNVLGISRDITERKLAEDALRTSEDRLRLVIDTIPALVWSALPDGSLDFINQRHREFTGLSLDDVRGWRWTEVIHPEDRARLIEEWRTALATGEQLETEARLRRAYGDYRWLLIHAVPPADESGKSPKWYGTKTDITERKQAEEQLKVTSKQLRSLSASLQSAREEERTRIARELHDELGSALTSLRWSLDEIDSLLSTAPSKVATDTLRKKIATMTTLVEGTLQTVRRISSELRPGILDDVGLRAAIEWEVQQFQARSGIVCHFDSSVERVSLTRAQSTAVFRIFQETLTNVLGHAKATKVDVTIREEGGQFVLTISDNGRGITEEEKSGAKSLGLLGMRERAYLIGGEVNITGVGSQGTMVTVRVPVSGAQPFEE